MNNKVDELKTRFKLLERRRGEERRVQADINAIVKSMEDVLLSMFPENVKDFMESYKKRETKIDDYIFDMRQEWSILAASCSMIQKSFEAARVDGEEYVLHKEYGFKRYRSYRTWDPFAYSMREAFSRPSTFVWKASNYSMLVGSKTISFSLMVNNPRINQKKLRTFFAMTGTMCTLFTKLNALHVKYEVSITNAETFILDCNYFEDKEEMDNICTDAPKAARDMVKAMNDFDLLETTMKNELEVYKQFNVEYKVLAQLTGKEMKLDRWR
ncbi:MAG: hypothetical protein GKC08_05665 [Methanosarcinales archaeon]|nr:hypothetical protein [Methanosarcinales archaeon]